MPLVRIDVIAPKTDDHKRALLAATRRAIVEGLAAEDRRVVVRVVDTARGDMDLPSCRTERFTVVDILLYEGRSPEMKAATATALRAALEVDPGIEPSEVAVFFHDATTSDLDVLPGQADLQV
jgi:phenylpyruvate tautomerase PptA (4-oxalocrotonate tautomerase family)